MEREEGKKCEKWNCGSSGPTVIHIAQHVVSSVVTGASRSCSAEACIMLECVFVHVCVCLCVCVEQCSRDVGGRWGYWAAAGHRADQSRAITVEREKGEVCVCVCLCVCVCVLGGLMNAERWARRFNSLLYMLERTHTMQNAGGTVAVIAIVYNVCVCE